MVEPLLVRSSIRLLSSECPNATELAPRQKELTVSSLASSFSHLPARPTISVAAHRRPRDKEMIRLDIFVSCSLYPDLDPHAFILSYNSVCYFLWPICSLTSTSFSSILYYAAQALPPLSTLGPVLPSLFRRLPLPDLYLIVEL